MKNLLQATFLFIALLFTGQIIAQTSAIGLRVGGTAATYNDDPMQANIVDLEQKYLIGMNFAVFGKFNLPGVFSLQPELHYLQKGTKYTSTSNDLDVKLTEKYDFLELPILARADFGEGNVRFNAFAGPSVGLAMAGKVKAENIQIRSEAIVVPGDFEEEIEWDTEFGTDGIKDNRFDLGVIGGVGVEFDLGPVILVVDGRYNWDFLDRVIYEEEPNPEPDNYYNRNIQFTAGVAIPFNL